MKKCYVRASNVHEVYEITAKQGPERYRFSWDSMNSQVGLTSGQNHIRIYNCTRGADKSGGGRGVESISLLERRIHLTQLRSSSPLLEQTSHPPTCNLVGKTHAILNQRIGARAPMAQDRSLLQDPRWRRRCGRRQRRQWRRRQS